MRIQCDVCEKAEAALVCCADEAALCAACDSQVHAANKLAGKHQRLPLIKPSQSESPRCDICQEKTGWFFCVEDRALLCRSCDFTIHSSNALASGHKRYLITGSRVALSALSAQDFLDVTTQTSPQGHINNGLSSSPSTVSGTSLSEHGPANGTQERVETGASLSRTEPIHVLEKRNSSTISEYLTEGVPGWRVDELLNIPELAPGYTIGDVGSSKADAPNLGEFDWLADLSLFEEQSYAETFHEVPQLTPAPSTGVAKPPPSKGKSKMSVSEADDSLLVPDMFLPSSKRRRTLAGV